MIFKKWLYFLVIYQDEKLTAVRNVPETELFQALGSFGTLDPKLSHGTSSKLADVRTHLRKVSKITLSSIWKEPTGSFSIWLVGQHFLRNFESG